MLGDVSTPVCFDGLVLVGGASSRMGENKALLRVEGMPLWERQAGVLAKAGSREVALSVRQRVDWLPGGWRQIEDAAADAGPLAGLAAALQVTNGTHVQVVAVDLPKVTAAWFRRLQGSCRAGVGAVGQWAASRAYEPLAAIFPTSMATSARAALAAGRGSLQALVSEGVRSGSMATVVLSEQERSLFTNWNSPEDLRR